MSQMYDPNVIELQCFVIVKQFGYLQFGYLQFGRYPMDMWQWATERGVMQDPCILPALPHPLA